VGTIFAIGLVILSVAVMTVGSELPGFSRRVPFTAVFPSTDGLLLGAPVRMAGVDIGEVNRIRLPVDPEVMGIEIMVGIEPLYAPRIRADSSASLRILQLLTNEKYVEVTAGSVEQPELPPGSTLPVRQDLGVLARGEAIAENLVDITAALKRILEPMERGEGLLGKIIQDPEFGLEGVEALGQMLKNARTLSDDLVAGRGVIGRLLQDDDLGVTLEDLGGAIQDFASLMESVSEKDGVLGELLIEGGSGQQAVRDLAQAAASFRRLGERLESEKSLLGQLLAERECAESVGGDICGTLTNLAEVTEKINRGEGSLGALVNERTLYDGAEDLVAGTNDSKFARWLLRHYRKRGIEAEEKLEQSAAAEPEEPAPGEAGER
jgi:phospholipid/cholesterol/gamma-HCH transport system substrate-binding protein